MKSLLCSLRCPVQDRLRVLRTLYVLAELAIHTTITWITRQDIETPVGVSLRLANEKSIILIRAANLAIQIE